MGREAKAKVERHIKRAFDGRPDGAMEMHRKYVWGGQQCFGCGSEKVSICIRSFAVGKDLVEKAPEVAAVIARAHGGNLPLMKTSYGVLAVPVNTVYACDNCKAFAERGAAKHPSWYFVDIDRGPGPDRPVVSVA